jgi:effector-binding domain-containing protein
MSAVLKHEVQFMIGEPTIDARAEQHYLGIRTQAPFRGMFAQVTEQFKLLNKWLKQHDIKPDGIPFLRYHVIDMAGEMDIEVGVVLSTPSQGDALVKPGILPAGRYASLIYVGLGLAANKALLEWIGTNNLRLDKWPDPKGEAFGCRYEAYLTDPKIEPRKKQWEIKLSMKLAEEQP